MMKCMTELEGTGPNSKATTDMPANNRSDELDGVFCSTLEVFDGEFNVRRTK